MEGEGPGLACILNGEILRRFCSLNVNWFRCITVSGGWCGLWVREMCSSVRKRQFLADGAHPSPNFVQTRRKASLSGSRVVFYLQRSKLGRNLGPAEAWERKQIESLPSTVSVPGVRVRCVRACVRRVCVVTGSRGCRDRSILSGGERGGETPSFLSHRSKSGVN